MLSYESKMLRKKFRLCNGFVDIIINEKGDKYAETYYLDYHYICHLCKE